ncbi:FeoC-like transcriptional regulator [Methylomicrobium lacus]|uniref:FeoC-like transcriptional regulator n=1 Tax=Methylomicrobium lacus TaxID=136992 RepID=UPI0035A8408A
MILSDLRNYIREQRRVALLDLANHFDVDAEALRGMLGKWISKGNLRKLPSGTACGGSCCKCDPASIELYEWIDKA